LIAGDKSSNHPKKQSGGGKKENKPHIQSFREEERKKASVRKSQRKIFGEFELKMEKTLA